MWINLKKEGDCGEMSMGKKWKGISLFCLNAKSNLAENIIIYVASEQE